MTSTKTCRNEATSPPQKKGPKCDDVDEFGLDFGSLCRSPWEGGRGEGEILIPKVDLHASAQGTRAGEFVHDEEWESKKRQISRCNGKRDKQHIS